MVNPSLIEGHPPIWAEDPKVSLSVLVKVAPDIITSTTTEFTAFLSDYS